MGERERKKRPLPFSIECLLSVPCEKKFPIPKDNCQIEPYSSCSSSPASTVLHRAVQSAEIRLEGASLWRRFHALGTEMIVTRSGRRMFPTLQVAVVRLERNVSYSLMIDFQCTDRKRYRYSFHQSNWVVAGPGEAEFPARMHVHPDSPASGEHWMRLQMVSFDKVKLTNNLLDQNGHAIVNSMHRYQPRFHLVVHPSSAKFNAHLNVCKRRTFAFPETAFMAVTAYQNHRVLFQMLAKLGKMGKITELKIESNPFAKGFRECDLLFNANNAEIVRLTDQTKASNATSAALQWLLQLRCSTSFALIEPEEFGIGVERTTTCKQQSGKKDEENKNSSVEFEDYCDSVRSE